LKVECKDCAAEFSIADDVITGEIITCPDCGSDFEITVKNDGGIETKRAESVGEDWGQ
jgi:alpha-aminoadipate carrier protein LysW